MKTASKIIALLTLAALWSCSNSDDNNPSPSDGGLTPDQVTGDWKVSYYYDDGKDETSDFSAFVFNFNADGSFEAGSSAQNYTGSWSMGEAGDDSSSSSKKMVINITGNDKINSLSDDWLILSVTSNEIRLKDDSDNSVEELYFVRN